MCRNKIKVIAIDCGKSNMKIVCGKESHIYRNNVKVGKGDERLCNKYTWNAIYDDEHYFVGDLSNGKDYQEGKASLEHIIGALTGVTLCIKPEKNQKVVLTYGESANKYFDDEQISSIKKSLKGEHELIRNGERFIFKIVDVYVVPEGIGHMLQDFDGYKGNRYVWDLGGKTWIWNTTEDCMPINEADKTFSTQYGMNNLVSIVKTKLEQNTDTSGYQTRDIEDFINNGTEIKSVKSIINKSIEEQFDRFENELETKGIDIHKIIKTGKLDIVGGGAITLKDQIEDRYGEDLIIDDPIFATARGMYEYGVSITEEDGEE